MRRCIEGWGWGIGGLKRRWGLVGQLHRASAQCRMSQRAPPQLLVAPNAAQLLILIQSKILNKLQFNSVHRVARKGVQAVSFFVHRVDRCQLHRVQRVLTVVATRGGYEPAAPIEAADNKRPGHIGCTRHQANLLAPDEVPAPGRLAGSRTQDLVIKRKYHHWPTRPKRKLRGPQFGVKYMTAGHACFV